jgi:preprotein translocase subunit SecD
MRRKHLTPLITIVVLALAALTTMLVREKRPQLGLDLQGGVSVVLQAKGEPTEGALRLATDKIRNRIDTLGVAEPEVTRQGKNIVVALPGVTDQERALKIVSQTGELRFRPVIQILPADEATGVTDISALQAQFDATSTTVATSGETVAGSTDSSSAPSVTTAALTSSSLAGGSGSRVAPRQSDTTVAGSTSSTGTTSTTVASSTTTSAGATTTTVSGETTTTVPLPTTQFKTTAIEDDDPTKSVVLPQRDKKTNEIIARYELGPAFLKGEAVSNAGIQFGQGWAVTLELKEGDQGISAWNKAAEECFNGAATCPARSIAIVLDGNVVSAPRIQPDSRTFSPFDRTQIQISGGAQNGFAEGEAQDLATVLKDGALPVALVPQAVQTVSATLGKDSLKAGIVAGLVGIGLVLLFMLLYYRSLAIVVVFGLMVSSAIMWSVIAWRGAVLTLAGAAGIIVSIGVTVDSYVVFFERLKDGVQSGRSLKGVVGKGFTDAWRTIVAADTVSLLAAAVLWWQTVGAVRGFAFYLGLSTLIDMVVAYFFTRNAVTLMAQSKRFAKGRVLGVTTAKAAGAAV